MPSVFLDTNILIDAAIGKTDDARKADIALDIVRNTEFAISGQVAAEFCAVVRRRARGLPCLSVDVDLVRSGIAMSRRYQLSYWDGAILAAAERLGCDTVYSEDLNAGQAYGSVTVVDPFAEAA